LAVWYKKLYAAPQNKVTKYHGFNVLLTEPNKGGSMFHTS